MTSLHYHSPLLHAISTDPVRVQHSMIEKQHLHDALKCANQENVVVRHRLLSNGKGTLNNVPICLFLAEQVKNM